MIAVLQLDSRGLRARKGLLANRILGIDAIDVDAQHQRRVFETITKLLQIQSCCRDCVLQRRTAGKRKGVGATGPMLRTVYAGMGIRHIQHDGDGVPCLLQAIAGVPKGLIRLGITQCLIDAAFQSQQRGVVAFQKGFGVLSGGGIGFPALLRVVRFCKPAFSKQRVI